MPELKYILFEGDSHSKNHRWISKLEISFQVFKARINSFVRCFFFSFLVAGSVNILTIHFRFLFFFFGI